jgi:hypothetical protein
MANNVATFIIIVVVIIIIIVLLLYVLSDPKQIFARR